MTELRYLITSHASLEGVRLSRRGDWGNVPFDDENAAHVAIQRDARNKPFTVERVRYPAPGRR